MGCCFSDSYCETPRNCQREQYITYPIPNNQTPIDSNTYSSYQSNYYPSHVYAPEPEYSGRYEIVTFQ